MFLRGERSERSLLGNFLVCLNSRFFRSLGLFLFSGFGLLFLRSERSKRSLVGNFWVCSKFRFVGIFGFGLLFLRSERSLLGNFWVCSNSGLFFVLYT